MEVDGQGLASAVVLAAFLAGFRHGFDIDHVAAISDITSSQTHTKRSLLLATSYAIGHMVVLLPLGIVAVVAGGRIPAAADSLAGRAIGMTLIVLGTYVVYSLIRFRGDFRIRSRSMLVLAGVRRVLHRFRRVPIVVIEHEHDHPTDGHHLHEHDLATGPDPQDGQRVLTSTRTHTHVHRHVVSMPADPFTEYGVKTSFVVGMFHGVGAETPTQVLLFTSAAGVAGAWPGAILVVAFSLGLLLGNTVLAVVTAYGFAGGRRLPLIHIVLAAATATVSIYVGIAYLLARPDLLPSLLGG